MYVSQNVNDAQVTAHSIEANFRVLNDVLLHRDKLAQGITSKLIQLLNAARDEAIAKV